MANSPSVGLGPADQYVQHDDEKARGYSGATSVTITFGLDAPASTLKAYLIIE